MILLPGGDRRCLVVCEHASARVPDGIDLGLSPARMATHIAVDIGAEALSRALARALDAPAALAPWSRLVVDLNRPPETAVPAVSDGVPIPGNARLSADDLAARMAHHHAFHDALGAAIADLSPRLLVSIHSFTPMLESHPAPRPWPIAVLWNRDEATARRTIEALSDAGVPGPIGANEPYSGRDLNYTMDRHGEDKGIPVIGLEVRQDQIGDASGVARWAAMLAPVIARMRDRLAPSDNRPPA